MVRIIVLAPWMDTVTAISAELSLKFAEWAKNKGHQVTVLFGWENTRLPFYLSALLNNPDLIVYNGHGSVDSLIGNELFLSLVTPFNANWLSKKITSTMACYSARELGKQVVEEGGYAYVGASDVLYAAFNEEYDYLSDWMEYMLLLPKGIVEDKPIGEALNDLKNKALFYANKYLSEKPDDSWDWYMNSTLHNSMVYTIVGNPSLRLSEVIKANSEVPKMNLAQGLTYLLSPDTIRKQWEDARRVLFSFGVVGAAVGSVVAGAAVQAVGGPEWAKSVAEKVGAIAGGAAIPI